MSVGQGTTNQWCLCWEQGTSGTSMGQGRAATLCGAAPLLVGNQLIGVRNVPGGIQSELGELMLLRFPYVNQPWNALGCPTPES